MKTLYTSSRYLRTSYTKAFVWGGIYFSITEDNRMLWLLSTSTVSRLNPEYVYRDSWSITIALPTFMSMSTLLWALKNHWLSMTLLSL